MGPTIEHLNEIEKTVVAASVRNEERGPVLEELNRILESRFFKHAGRSSQFLDYVVRHKLEGHAEQLKERTIGTEVFQRAPGYATGDDPVVRVQAGEVRRRLEQYYQSLPSGSALRIELQPGSYSPNFLLRSEGPGSETPPAHLEKSADSPRSLPAHLVTGLMAATCLVLLLGAGLIYLGHRRAVSGGQPTAQTRFWAPVFATQQPVLICLAKPVVYRPSFALYQRYAKNHPGAFETEVERSNQRLSLDPNAMVPWRDVVPYPDYGVAVGDVYAAVRVSSLFGQIGKPSQVRIGSHYSFEDLSNSPSVIVGAFNNKWTMQVMRGLRFSFVEDKGNYQIREQSPGGRIWRSSLTEFQQGGNDYAIVARLLDSKTGQFTVVAAGITGSGTQTAGEFISNSDFLDRGFQSVSKDWQNKNVELILETTVIDSVAGPPRVVASYTW
ncbi:MAG TPA: hypothetical protein VF730_00520 [Terracidiphilus sp.]